MLFSNKLIGVSLLAALAAYAAPAGVAAEGSLDIRADNEGYDLVLSHERSLANADPASAIARRDAWDDQKKAFAQGQCDSLQGQYPNSNIIVYNKNEAFAFKANNFKDQGDVDTTSDPTAEGQYNTASFHWVVFYGSGSFSPRGQQDYAYAGITFSSQDSIIFQDRV
ncbi:uncharacterized protein EHS24_006131 [Apiotrichum porosum]|uniref:Secreted protein n=1 Tax=Apiotrichum porosum TaxID=105984 RepID=A0A427Y0J0_9TREE|nr:uncharacterized protein EHS24_006131 [Apiotrichum porosum]RSH84607.1 hypothetical protein EHS24_006131 [Apiotrichum porosum]